MKKKTASYWLSLEDRIRIALREWRRDEETFNGSKNNSDATIFLIDAILGEETGRGYELDNMK